MTRKILLLAALLYTSIAMAQDKYIVLQQEKMATAPSGYYINSVVDDRSGKDALGTIHYSNGTNGKVVLKGGSKDIMSYVENNIKQNKAAMALSLHIVSCNIDITKQGDEWNINSVLTLAFYGGSNMLVQYAMKGKSQTSDDPGTYIEGFIRRTIEGDMKSFNKWWPDNKDKMVINDEVEVNVHIGNKPDNADEILYSLQQPLQIADFTGPARPMTNEAAETFSIVDMKTHSHTENGHTVLDIVITPLFDKKQSWFREDGKLPAVLAHEQAHFDIAAIKACELVNSIRAAKITKANYATLPEQLRAKNAAETTAEQEAYDGETNHGTIPDKQHEWEQKLKEQVRAVGCY